MDNITVLFTRRTIMNHSIFDEVGLIHMSYLKPIYEVTYEQVGGFGPVSRDQAFKAIKQAGNIGHIRPDTVWVQRGNDLDDNLRHAIRKAKDKGFYVRDNEYHKDIRNENQDGWGVYYQFGRYVIIEHTSDPYSYVTKRQNNKRITLPHFHIQITDLVDGKENKAFRYIKQVIPNSKPDQKKYEWKLIVTRGNRLGNRSPLTPRKPKFNHHLYYLPLT